MFEPSRLKEFLEPLKAARAKPYTLEHLAEWLETKEGEYDWYDIHNCLICQYLNHIGVKYSSVGASDYALPNGSRRVAIPKFFADIGSVRPATFGAALGRTRAAIAARAS